jgi:N-acetyl sugar amidotransferase
MDTSDPEIVFDANGLCSHCVRYDSLVRTVVERANSGLRLQELSKLINQIRKAGKGKPYDCIIGLSGGVDSTYLAWLAKQHGLRPLAVHFDSGWNSELAVNNIEKTVKTLGLDLQTFVVDWEEMRDLQLAFFKASVANCDIPTDHAFPAVLYREAVAHRIRYVLSGSNYATEFILPTAWGYQSADLVHLRDIHRKFATVRLQNYPTMGFFAQYLWYPYVRRLKTVKLLNFVPYIKSDAKHTISRELGWRDYGGKHHESVFTRFFQSHYLPTKFGYDKRRAHLSSLINSGQSSRASALAELESPACDPATLTQDKPFVARKLGISEREFDRLIAQPVRPHSDFASLDFLFVYGLRIKRALYPL